MALEAGTPKQQTNFQSINEAIETRTMRTQKIAERLHALADRLFGPVPQVVNDETSVDVDSAAAVTRLDAALDSQVQALNYLEQAADRLEYLG